MTDVTEINLAREPPFALGDATVRPSTRELIAGGRAEVLEPRVMQVLVALARRRGEVVSRRELIASCWGGRTVVDEAIRRCIGTLRRQAAALGEFSITTVARVGYRLDALGASGPIGGAPSARASICVLPFANMGDDPEQEYFGEGLSEDIITDLANVPALFVVARNTAFTFRGRNLDLRQVARELNVSHVLEGSVRKAGGRLRISAQLIDGASGGHVWAERYDLGLGDIFALQDEIAKAVVLALKVELLPQQPADARRGTANPDAYNLLLQARHRSVSGNQNLASAEEVLRLARRATEIDPRYARAWAMVARFQRILTIRFGKPGVDGSEAANRALEIDPGLAEAYAEKAAHLAANGRRPEALAVVEVALRLDPESYEANWCAAALCLKLGRVGEAVSYFEKAAALMETSFSNSGMLISLYSELGDAEGVRRAAKMTLARAEAALAQDQSNGSAMAFGVGALAALGDAERAKDWIRRGLQIDPDNSEMHYNFACALIRHLKDIDGALDLIELRLATATRKTLNNCICDPDMNGIRDDPRFVSIVAAAEARLAAAVEPLPAATIG